MKVVELPPAGLRPEPDLKGEALAHSAELEAVRLFAETGSLTRVAASLGVSLYQLKKLSKSDWWRRELAELQSAEAAELNVRLTTILGDTLEALADRVLYGDFVSAGGKLARVPLSATTLSRVTEVVFDKRQLVRQQPTSISDVANGKLEALARQLRALGAKDISLLEEEVIDIPEGQVPSQERFKAEESLAPTRSGGGWPVSGGRSPGSESDGPQAT